MRATPEGGEQFWVGWERRKLGGKGLKLKQQTKGDSGESAFKNVHLHAGTSHPGQLAIPSTFIFEPTAIPVGSLNTCTYSGQFGQKIAMDIRHHRFPNGGCKRNIKLLLSLPPILVVP